MTFELHLFGCDRTSVDLHDAKIQLGLHDCLLNRRFFCNSHCQKSQLTIRVGPEQSPIYLEARPDTSVLDAHVSLCNCILFSLYYCFVSLFAVTGYCLHLELITVLDAKWKLSKVFY